MSKNGLGLEAEKSWTECGANPDWKVQHYPKATHRAVTDPILGTIARLTEAGDPYANLIAAAPEMLAFVKKWSRHNIEAEEHEQDKYDQELEALIAKAEGRS